MDNSKPLNLFICGMKHCGKSTHAKRYATAKGFPFADLDELIEQLYFQNYGKKLNCRQIYKKVGRQGFYSLETKALSEYLKNDFEQPHPRVLALGGGIASNQEALVLLLANGYPIYLYQDEEVIFSRLKENGMPAYLGLFNRRKKFHKIYIERAINYETIAACVVSPEDIPTDEAQIIFAATVDDFIKKITLTPKKRGKK